MSEKLDRSQTQTAMRVSKEFENAWRVYTHPKDYTFEEVRTDCYPD